MGDKIQVVWKSWNSLYSEGRGREGNCLEFPSIVIKVFHLDDTCFVLFCFCIFRAAPVAYGDSQARGLIQAVAARLRHSHSNAGSKPYTTAHSDAGSLTHRPGMEPETSWFLVGFVSTAPSWELRYLFLTECSQPQHPTSPCPHWLIIGHPGSLCCSVVTGMGLCW